MKITTRGIGGGDMVEVNYELDGVSIKETIYSAKDILEFISSLNTLQDELFWYLEKELK